MAPSDGDARGIYDLRIYANLTNEYDFVSAVYGDSQDPMFLNTQTSFKWQLVVTLRAP